MKRSKPPRAGAASDTIRSILFATDLSARSDRAFARAVELARSLRARLTVLHVVDDELPAALIARRRDETTALIAQELSAAQPPLRAEVRVEAGDVYAVILRCARAAAADLIVLGMHRARPLADLFLGTTVERVARLGGVPVLVVKNRVTGPYRTALAAVDFSPGSRQAVAVGRKVAPHAAFTLAHAYHTPFAGFLGPKNERKAEREAHARGLARLLDEQMGTGGKSQPQMAPPILKEGTVPEVVAAAARRSRAELLVLGTHGRSAVATALLGSIAASFLNDPPCDVLAVPMK